jgi:hypothetical protein
MKRNSFLIFVNLIYTKEKKRLRGGEEPFRKPQAGWQILLRALVL